MRKLFAVGLGLATSWVSACRPSDALPEPPITQTTSTAAPADANAEAVTPPPPAPSASVTPVPTPAASASSPAAPALSFLGATSWTSNACPGRSYKRTLSLLTDHTFRADDIVHPCAGECVVQWTDKRTGAWSVAAGAVSLVVKKEDGPDRERKEAAPLPTVLTVDAASHTLREPNAACVYTLQ